MEVIKFIGIVLVALVVIIILKSVKKEDMALSITLIASVILLGVVFVKIESIVALLEDLVKKAGIDSAYLAILLKVTGISYLVELTSNVCKDAGSAALATKVEMFGKISIVILTVPILTSIVSTILELV